MIIWLKVFSYPSLHLSIYFILFLLLFLVRAKGGNRGSISRLHVEVSNIWVLFVFYFSAFGITCNVAEMKEKVRDLQRFYRHINQKETFPLNGFFPQGCLSFIYSNKALRLINASIPSLTPSGLGLSATTSTVKPNSSSKYPAVVPPILATNVLLSSPCSSNPLFTLPVFSSNQSKAIKISLEPCVEKTSTHLTPSSSSSSS